MRARRWAAGGVVVLCSAVGISLSTGACSSDTPETPDGAVLDGGDSGFDAPQGCELSKDPKDSPECVANSVGIFVSPTGDDTNPGTKEKPVKTLGKALGIVAGRPRIYVCEGTYTGSLDVAASVGIFGALKCDWTPSTTRPVIVGDKSAYAVQVTAPNASLVDVEVLAKAGVAAGESSIGVFANGAQNLKLTRVKVTAGAGVKGADGATGSNYATIAQSDPKITGNPASGPNGGGLHACTNCTDGKNSVGGAGGAGGGAPTDGQVGQPILGGGTKGTAGNPDGGVCTNGGTGTSPSAGLSATAGTGIGTLDGTGWKGSNGGNGANGPPAQGGGGGGGGYDVGNNVGGGGGGGCGGCGGAAGTGGGAGGSSIAVASFNATVSLTACELGTSSASDGGKGASGQPGQLGGFNGTPTSQGCSGGTGGTGGAGGSGGGGAGGVSVGILYKGTKPTSDAATDGKITFGNKGNKGIGGSAGTNDGIDGVAQAVLQVQ